MERIRLARFIGEVEATKLGQAVITLWGGKFRVTNQDDYFVVEWEGNLNRNYRDYDMLFYFVYGFTKNSDGHSLMAIHG